MLSRFFQKAEMTVVVVCTANVCRSPAAEALMRSFLQSRGLRRRVRVLSAGTQVASPGRHPDPRMISIAAESGIKMKSLRASPVTASLLAEANMVFCMDASHKASLEQNFSEVSSKVLMFNPDERDVADPFFGSKQDVRRAFDQIESISRIRTEWLISQLN